MARRAKRGCLFGLMLVLAVAVAGTAFVFWQGRREPVGRPVYVALGSSYAAGAGLGPNQPGSPSACGRSAGGYPPRLARKLGIPLVDMSCGGAVTAHVLDGGQYFQGPQLRVIDRTTRLVTITAGGNDIGYVADLSMLAARRSGGLSGWAARNLWGGPKTMAQRDFAGVERRLGAIFAAIHRRAPAARIVVATYPRVLPAAGTCPRIAMTAAEAATMRAVGDRLAEVTIAAATRSGATVVDMHALGQGHDACSPSPWIGGWVDPGTAPFHPTALGAQATADAIAAALGPTVRPAPAISR